jgi:hypothetical protein
MALKPMLGKFLMGDAVLATQDAQSFDISLGSAHGFSSVKSVRGQKVIARLMDSAQAQPMEALALLWWPLGDCGIADLQNKP